MEQSGLTKFGLKKGDRLLVVERSVVLEDA
jgi:hypothetical protein